MAKLNTDPLLRMHQIIGNKYAVPPVPPIIPVSKSVWLRGCRDGRYPAPLKLSKRLLCWRSSDIAALLATLTGEK